MYGDIGSGLQLTRAVIALVTLDVFVAPIQGDIGWILLILIILLAMLVD